MTGATAPEMLAVALPASLFLYQVWRREWEWTGLYLALSFAISLWIKCGVLFSHLWNPSAPQPASLGWAIIGVVLYSGGMLGAMRGPSTLRTLFIALAAMETLFVGIVPLYRFAFDLDQDAYFIINGQAVSDALGATAIVVFALAPTMIGIPWMLARQSASGKTSIAPALSRYGMLSGFGVVAFMVFSTCFVAWGYVGYGPFSGVPQRPAFPIERSLVGPNSIFGMLIGAVIFLFWMFPQRFFDPVVKLLEQSQDIGGGPLEHRAHPLWRGVARNLDEGRREALDSQKELNQMRTLLLSFFNTAPADMFVKTVEGQLVHCSPGLATVLGRTQEEMAGMFETEYHSPAHMELVRKIDAKLVRDRKPLVAEVFNPILKRHELQTRFPIMNDAGEVTHIGGMFIDIDERVKAQKDQKKAEVWLEAFVNNAPVPMILADPANDRYLLANSVAAEFYDITAAELLASNPADAMQYWPRWEEDMAPAMRKALIDRQPQNVETLLMRKREGTVANYFVSLFPIVDETRKLPLLASVGIDITAIRQAESALAANKEAMHQSEKLAALGQLLAGVAHELNNPLTVVVGRSAILQEKLAGGPHEKAIAGLREAADRCNRIVKTFLAMARQSAPRRGAVQINEVIEAALEMTAYGIRSAGIELERKLAPGLPDVDADEDQMVQVITNLLLNAQHALEAHDGPRRIRIATKAVRGRVQLSIADSGPGVPDELRSRIFEPFFTTKEVGQGTGMGLAMARGMIEEHGGELSYRDARGGGARFEISLPAAGAAQGAEAEAAELEPISDAKGRVLIVDDEDSIRTMLAEVLTLSDLECVEAANGRVALDLLERELFDLIFCDVRMPGMDGIELRRALATSRPDLLEKLVFMSGDVLQRERARYAEIKDHIFVEKPFDPAEVRRIAQELLDRQGVTA